MLSFFFKKLTILLILLALPAVSALGQTPAALGNTTVLHLTETAQRNVPRDRLRVELAVEVTDSDAAKVQAEINRRMADALARIKSVPEITLETNGYNVFQENPGKTPPRWHGLQSVSLASKDFAKLLALVGTLQQDGLMIGGLTPELSREAQESVEDALTDEALARLRQRADRIAAGLGTKVDVLRDLRIGNAATPSPPVRFMAVAGGVSSSAPGPVAEAGEAVVSVTVQADIALAK